MLGTHVKDHFKNKTMKEMNLDVCVAAERMNTTLMCARQVKILKPL